MIDLATIPDDVLIARGKYSTLNSRARELRLKIRDQMHSMTDQARTVVRLLDSTDVDPDENLANMRALLNAADEAWKELAELATQLNELQPAAWPKGKRNAKNQ